MISRLIMLTRRRGARERSRCRRMVVGRFQGKDLAMKLNFLVQDLLRIILDSIPDGADPMVEWFFLSSGYSS